MGGSKPGHVAVAQIAAAHQKSVSQVCLRYILQRGCAMAVGTGADASTVGVYAKENLDIYDFNLTDEDMKTLNAI